MKSVFITFDQAFFERIMALLDRQGCRGFSYWQQVQDVAARRENRIMVVTHGPVCALLLLLL